MVISRFWLSIILISCAYILALLFSGRLYSIDGIVNGKKDDPLIVKETTINLLSLPEQAALKAAANGKYIRTGSLPNHDTVYALDKDIVRISVGKQAADGLLPACKNALIDLLLPLVACLAFFCGLMQLLIDSGAAEKLARLLSPVFRQLFPEVPANHPATTYMMLNFAANFLGLDSAATPFGLKAMESLQELNPDKERASNAQILFMCMHAAGLTLIPTSIIGYRAAQNAHNPADVVIPCIITSFVGTLAAVIIVGIRQKLKLQSAALLGILLVCTGCIAGFMFYIHSLSVIEKNHVTGNFSNALLLLIIVGIFIYAFMHEKVFTQKGTPIFESFAAGASEGLKTGVKIFPYIMGMLAAISLLRNSGVFEMITGGLAKLLLAVNVGRQVVDAMPVALLRPFSSGGSRGFMIDAMQTYGADSFTGRLVCVFQCSAETTFYVLAVYFGSIGIKNTRYTTATMLWVDAICVLTAIAVCSVYF